MQACIHTVCDDWALTPDGDVLETPSSWLLPVTDVAGASLQLKVLRPGSDEAPGFAALAYFGTQAAVRIVCFDERALLMERIAGDSIGQCMLRGSLDDAEATRILADVVERLHAPRVAPLPDGLWTLRRRFAALIERHHDGALLQRCAADARRLLDDPLDPVVLHGDLHHANVLHHPDRGWLAIDAKGIVGERTFELASLLSNPHTQPALVRDPQRLQRTVAEYARRLDLPVLRVARMGRAFMALSALWSLDDGEDAGLALSCACILDALCEVRAR